MRISDWSSDVCSSDLVARINADANVERQLRLAEAARANLARRIGRPIDGALDDTLLDRLSGANIYGPVAPVRSEEHTSALQSLMRISYSVFCLKNKIYLQFGLLYCCMFIKYQARS